MTSTQLPRWRRAWIAGCGVILLAVAVGVLLWQTDRPGRALPWDCVTTNGVTELATWDALFGRRVNCAVVFADAAPTWQGWEQPWFLSDRRSTPQFDWVDWLAADRTHRNLVMTIGLTPGGQTDPDWLQAGAAGADAPYARVLARKLVAAGLGGIIIRLGHEANGTWYSDSLPDTPAGDAQWVKFWDETVTAMRSVRGAHFRFDWTVNPGYRAIPLGSWYPGNAFVDIIGVDAYDTIADNYRGRRLTAVIDQPDGIRAIMRFARAHGKPVSVPEWGVGPAAAPGRAGSGGPDPAYIDAISRLVRSGGVLYQSYFTGGQSGPLLIASPTARRAYRRHFGAGGDAQS